MILKLKALIYRHTGIYLAKKEERAYMLSSQSFEDLKQVMKDFDDITPKQGRDILLGLWQCDNGFAREYKRKNRK